jgi:hypothetical protein
MLNYNIFVSNKKTNFKSSQKMFLVTVGPNFLMLLLKIFLMFSF